MPDQAPKPSALRTLLREPTLHFAVLAAALFAVEAGVRARHVGDVIEVDRAEIDARIAEIESSLGTALSPEERRQVEEDYVDELVLVREALAMGLEDDPRIHDFLAQKMLHVLSADVIQPTDAELEAHYEANSDRYASPATATIEELVIATQDGLPPELARRLQQGASPDRIVTDLPTRVDVLPDVTLSDLGRIFGAGLAEAVFTVEIGQWVGPHRTVRGQHWLRVTELTESRSPPLESVREQVRLDWIVEQEEERLVRRLAELRKRYSIELTGPEASR